MIWIESTINLNFVGPSSKEEQNTEDKYAFLTARRESVMKALQIERYKKRRLDVFDFAYIGESEDFSIVL